MSSLPLSMGALGSTVGSFCSCLRCKSSMAGREGGLNAHFIVCTFDFDSFVRIFLADGILPGKIPAASKIHEEVGN